MPPRIWPQEQFLAWLDSAKKTLGLPTDFQLAAHLGIGHTLISGWRGGRQRPSFETLRDIAEALGEDPRKLWVLAGLVSAEAVGIGAETNDMWAIPPEVRRILGLLADPRMDNDGRTFLLRHISLVAAGIEAELAEREASGSE